MNPPLVVQEFVIVVAAKNHNPSLLNPDFLKYSGIVPTEWELARNPVYTNRFTQITFTNGVSIVAEPNRVIFLEAIESKTDGEIATPAIARKYVEVLPKLEYYAIGINPRGYVSYEDNPVGARKYLSEKVLSPGAWQEVGTAPVQAKIDFVYTLERGSMNLSINEASLRFPDEKTVPVVLFSGNFSYDVTGETETERNSCLYGVIDNWQADLEIYKDIVNTKFLAGETKSTVGVKPELVLSGSAA